MNIVVPQLGESVIEARIARWLKKEGDAVAAGDPLIELETDKIDLEVNAESAGVLSRIERKDGEDVKVGEVLGVIEEGAGAQPVQPDPTNQTDPTRPDRNLTQPDPTRPNPPPPRLRRAGLSPHLARATRSKQRQPRKKWPASMASTCRKSPGPAAAAA